MRTPAVLALLLTGVLTACSGTDSATLSQSDQAFLKTVQDQAVQAPQEILKNKDVDPSIKNLIKDVERNSDQLAARSNQLLGDVRDVISDNPSAQALIEQANAAIDQTQTKAEATKWLEAVIKQREYLIEAAQAQINATSNEEVRKLAEQVKADQTALVEQLRAQLAELSK